MSIWVQPAYKRKTVPEAKVTPSARASQRSKRLSSELQPQPDIVKQQSHWGRRQPRGSKMLPDYRTAEAVRSMRLEVMQDVDGNRPDGSFRHSLVERLDLMLEVRLHQLRDAYRNRPPRPRHWPPPVPH